MKKLRIATSIRPMSLAFGQSSLYVSILETEMKKLVLKLGSKTVQESVFESKFHVASACPGSRNILVLSQSLPRYRFFFTT